MIFIIDYGMGNLGSIVNMLKKVGTKAAITSDTSEIMGITQEDKIILPGVGAFESGMTKLVELGLVDVLNEIVLEKKVPTLGVCLGMQLLTRSSEESKVPGLGWINGDAIRFRFGDDQDHLKIPHMGWNTIKIEREGTLFQNFSGEARFYFVHSYHVVCKDPADVLTKTDYGYEFASSVQKDNVMGVQFHPEKSHRFGMNVYKNFVELS